MPDGDNPYRLALDTMEDSVRWNDDFSIGDLWEPPDFPAWCGKLIKTAQSVLCPLSKPYRRYGIVSASASERSRRALNE